MLPPSEPVLFPDIEPYNTGFLHSGLHRIYWEVCGNPNGKPVVFLHGGPGSGCKAWQRCLYDPSIYRIILFDQRGCGRSTPHLELSENTTDHLIADMESLRTELGVESWTVFGGSWGSTLGLAYADAHPERVSELVIYGIFLCSQSELDGFYTPGGIASLIYPDLFAHFIEPVPENRRHDVIEFYWEQFHSTNESIRNDALDRWTRWENATLKLIPDKEGLARSMADKAYVASHSLIENHYFRHNGFIDKNALLQRIGTRLARTPVFIVSGRYDIICPPITAWQVHKAIPGSRWIVVPDAGHTAKEPGTMAVLLDIFRQISP